MSKLILIIAILLSVFLSGCYVRPFFLKNHGICQEYNSTKYYGLSSNKDF